MNSNKNFYSKSRDTLTKTLQILTEIAELLDEGLYAVSFNKLKRDTNYMSGDPRRNRNYRNNLKSLERSGYLKINRKVDSVELTTKGRIKLLENSLEKRIDGKWRLLSWDVPENLKEKRNQFRRSIKRIGYKQIQKSLWACPFVVADQIELIIDDLELQNYIAYIVTDKTNIQEHLKNLFSEELEKEYNN